MLKPPRLLLMPPRSWFGLVLELMGWTFGSCFWWSSMGIGCSNCQGWRKYSHMQHLWYNSKYGFPFKDVYVMYLNLDLHLHWGISICFMSIKETRTHIQVICYPIPTCFPIGLGKKKITPNNIYQTLYHPS